MSENEPLAAGQPEGDDRRNYGAVDEQNDEDASSIESIVDPNAKIRHFLIFVPMGCILLFTAFITLLLLDFRNATAPKRTLILVWTLTPFCTAVVAWIANYAIKSSLLNCCTSLGRGGEYPATFIQVLVTELIRLATILINRPDPHLETDAYSFYTSCWVALGWAAAEVVASITQGYSHLVLYRDYADHRDDNDASVEMRQSVDAILYDEHVQQSPVALSQYIDDQLVDLLNIKRISELEEAYGLPITDIPIVLSAIQRIDSILASVGLTLILSSAFHHPQDSLALPFLVAVLIHTLLSTLWTPRVLPVIGIHTASFVAATISIGCIWAGLWRWGIVV